ncbi:MAG: hypothetical protein KF819_02355 [Labilithrix sp.]|nr:hypothetical protein [Labilithrix sp.]
MNRRGEAAERFAERRRQEDAAPRLRDVVPDLVSCRIEITQGRSEAMTADIAHTRHVVVERAPALLVVACYESSCRDGGHDISSTLLRGLRERRRSIEGEETCHGTVGAGYCGRVLRFIAAAEYKTAT